jgi:hypothetical protein
MPLYLKNDPAWTGPGSSYYSDPLLGEWRKPTGVYVPPGVDLAKGPVNVLLYLHGWYVKKMEDLFTTDASSVRNQVVASGKKVILIAPYLGSYDGTKGDYSTRDLTGNWGERFIFDALNALIPPTPPPSNLSRGGLSQVGRSTPSFQLGNLVIAAHSGGGAGMRTLVGALGRFKANLTECWGFDCLYGAKIKPDDATFWFDFVNGSDGCPLWVIFGPTTAQESVKLYLMKEGLATRTGARAVPQGAQVMSIEVEPGLSSPKTIEELMGLKDLPARSDSIVEKALANLNKNIGWPQTSDGRNQLHYAIVRDGLLDMLKTASYL